MMDKMERGKPHIFKKRKFSFDSTVIKIRFFSFLEQTLFSFSAALFHLMSAENIFEC